MTLPSTSIGYLVYARKSSEAEDKQVASVDSQIAELTKLAEDRNIHIVRVYTEEMSAKAPGRPVFNQMLQDIHSGKAKGILCWKLDRLARNPVDGGNVTWMLQQGVIHQIQTFQRAYFPTDNVLYMQLEFGMANQFVRDLSDNTKRGMRSSVADGWFPHKPPIGYLNNKHKLDDKLPIFIDEKNFPLVRKLWDILITKKCSVDVLYEMANKMGLRTNKGKFYARSSFYSLFNNPFYYGHFLWKGQVYEGKHEPMITKTEFNIVQQLMNGRGFTKKQNHIFAFRGLIRCGECGASITAEDKEKHQKNGNVHRYTYYRCTKRIDRHCSQMPIRSDELEKQIIRVLDRITIPHSFREWAIETMKEEHAKEIAEREDITQAQRKCLDDCERRLDTLINMRMNNEVSPEEYTAKKAIVTQEKTKYEELLKDTSHRRENWIKQAEAIFDFAERAKEKFETGTLEDKRTTLSILGSNLILRDKTLEISLEQRLALFLTVAPEVRELHARLEPTQVVENAEGWEKIYGKNKKWGE